MYNADVLLARPDRDRSGANRGSRRSSSCRSRTRSRAGSAPASRWRCSRSSSSRSSSGRSRRARSSTASTTSRRSAAASTSAPRRRRRARSATCAPRSRHAPGVRAADIRVVSSQSLLPVKAHQVGTPGEGRAVPRPRRRRGVPRPHDLRLRRDRARATARPPRSGARSARIPDLAVVDSLVVPRKSNYNFGATSEVPAHGLLPRGRHVHARSASTCATRRPAGSVRLTVIGVLSDTAPLAHGGHLDVAEDARRARSATASCRPCTSFALAARRRPEARRQGARVGVPRERHAGGLAATAARRRGLREPHLRPADRGLHGARPDRRRRRARRRSAPARWSSAGSRSACCAPSASAGAWCRLGFLLESSFVALTAIVVGTALGLAVGVQRHRRHAAPAELAEHAASTSRG